MAPKSEFMGTNYMPDREIAVKQFVILIFTNSLLMQNKTKINSLISFTPLKIRYSDIYICVSKSIPQPESMGP